VLRREKHFDGRRRGGKGKGVGSTNDGVLSEIVDPRCAVLWNL